MKTGTSISAMVALFVIAAIIGCGGGGGDDFSQPLKPSGGVATDAAQPGEVPAAPPSEPKAEPTPPAVAASAAAPPATKAPAAQVEAPAGGGGLGLFGAAATAPSPAAPAELVEGIAASPVGEGIAADLSSDGRLLVAERGDGRFGVYEVNRRTNLMSLAAAENKINKLTFDANRALITAILPSGKIQVWKYQSTLGLDKFAKESIASDSFLRGFEGHPGGTLDLAVSPTRDEMVTVGADGQLRFWRVNDSTSTRPFERSGTELEHLVVSPGGGFATALTAKGIVTIWETASGKARTMPLGDRAVTCLTVDTKGSLIAAGDSSGTVVLLDVASGRTNELSLGRQPVADVRFEEESQRLFAISVDGETRAWNLPLASSTTIEGITAAGGLMAVSGDMKRVAAPDTNGGLTTVALSGDAALQELTTSLKRITAVEYTDGDSVIIGSESGQVEIQEATGLKKLIATGGTAMSQLKCSSDGMLATLDKQGNAGIWDTGESQILAKFSGEAVVASASDPVAAALAVVFQSGKQLVVDLSNGEAIATRQSDDKDVTCVAMDFRRNLVAFGHASGKVSLWLFREKSELIMLGQHASGVTQIRIGKSGEFVYTGASDGTVCNWPTQIKNTAPVLEKLPGEIRLAEFASNQALGVASTDMSVFAIDLLTGTVKELSGLPRPVHLHISPDGSRFASITAEGTANIYDAVSGQLLRQHSTMDQIVDVGFLNVERTYLSLDAQGMLRRWTRPSSALTSVSESFKGAEAAWLNPSGSILAIASESKLIRFLSVADDYKLLSTVTVENGVQLLTWISDQSCAVTSPGAKSVSLIELQGGRVRKALVDLPGAATQFCRRADNGDLLAICGTRLLKVRPASGDIRVNDISFKASDQDQIVNCGKTTMLLSGGRVFRIGRDDKVVIDERVANIKSLHGSVSERAAVLITESGNMLAFSDDKYTDAGMNPLPGSTVMISDDGQYLWIQPEAGEGLVWSVRAQKSLQTVAFSGSAAVRSWLPDQRALVQVDAAGTVSLLENLVTSEWSTGVPNAQSLSVSSGGNLALVKDAGGKAVILDLGTRQARPIELTDAVFSELSDDAGTVVTVSSAGKIERISATGIETQQVEGPVSSVSMDRANNTLTLNFGVDKCGLFEIDRLSNVQSLAVDKDYKRMFSTSAGCLLTDSNGALKFAERGVQSSGMPQAGHPGGCSGIVVLQNQILTSGRDGVVRSWSPDLSNHRDIVKHGRSIVSLCASSTTQQLSVCDELGEALVFRLDGTIRNGASKIGLGPGSRTFGHDSDGNLLIAGTRQLVRFRSDGTPGDGLQFREDCVELGAVGNTGKWYAIEKNGNLYSFGFVRRRHSVQRNAKVSALYWTSALQLGVVSGKQVEIISADGDVVATSAVDTEVVASGVSPNGLHLAMLSVSGELTVFSTQSLSKSNSFRPGVAANRIAVGLTGETLLLYGIDSTEEWSAKGTRLRRLPVPGITSASYVEGTPFLITALKSGEVRQWPQQQMFTSRPSQTVKDSRLLPNGTGAIYLDDKGFVSAEHAENKVYWKSTEVSSSIRGSSVSSDGVRVALFTGSNGIRHASVYDQKSGLVKTFDVPPDCSEVQLSPDGMSILLNLEKSVEIRNIESGLVTQLLSIVAKRCLYVTHNTLLFLDAEGVLRIAGTGELGTMSITSGQGTAVAFDETGDRIATGTSEGIVTVWDRASSELKKVHEFTTASPVRQVILRGGLLVARTDLAAVSVWLIDSPDPAASGTISFAHRGVPQLARLDRKQELLATVNADNEVSVWDLANKGVSPRQVLSLTGQDQRVSALAFSEASDSLVTLDASGTVSINPLPDLATLRQRTTAEVKERTSSGILEELPLSLPGSGRSGGDPLSQRLRQEDSVRRELQAQRMQNQDDTMPRMGDRRNLKDLLAGIGTARNSQIRGLYQDQIVRNGEATTRSPSVGEPAWTPSQELVEDFQSVKTLPEAIAAAAASGTPNSTSSGTSSARENTPEGLVRELVSSQRSFVRQLMGSALKGLGTPDSGLPIDQKAFDAFRQQLEQMSDSRAIQTIPTDYQFPQENSEGIRVPLQISSDGSTVVASFPPLREEDSKGYLDVWDTLSAIPLKQFELTEPVQDLLFSTMEDQLLTMPGVSAYRLFDNSPPKYLTHSSSVAWCRSAQKPILAFTREVGSDSQNQLLALFDAKTLDGLPISMPEGFNTRAKAIAFGNTDDKLAVAISERGKDHKLFVCRTTDLSRFEVLSPMDTIDGSSFTESDGGAGFAALAFSPDDQTLLAVAHGRDGTSGFSVRLYSHGNEKWHMTASMPLPEEGFAGVGDSVTVQFVSQMSRVIIRTAVGVFVGDLNAGKKRRSDGVWGIPLSPELTRTAKLSEDGRWLAIGKSNGTIAIHDLSSADPTLSVPLPGEGDTAHDGAVIGLSFSRPLQGTKNPTYLASFGRENRLKVWALIDLEEQFAKARKAR